jgi:hypothetical protein
VGHVAVGAGLHETLEHDATDREATFDDLGDRAVLRAMWKAAGE